MITIDTTNLCSSLQKKLFVEDGIYHREIQETKQ